jgi:hypothetical protein
MTRVGSQRHRKKKCLCVRIRKLCSETDRRLWAVHRHCRCLGLDTEETVVSGERWRRSLCETATIEFIRKWSQQLEWFNTKLQLWWSTFSDVIASHLAEPQEQRERIEKLPTGERAIMDVNRGVETRIWIAYSNCTAILAHGFNSCGYRTYMRMSSRLYNICWYARWFPSQTSHDTFFFWHTHTQLMPVATSPHQSPLLQHIVHTCTFMDSIVLKAGYFDVPFYFN